MKYPTLNEIKNTRDMIDVFKGYNHNLRIGENEFYDMTNLSSDNYPTISPRSQRGVYKKGTIENPCDISGMVVAKDALCYVDGTRIIINGDEPIDMGLTIDYEYGRIKPKNLISMGAYIIIMPDKKYINTADYTDWGEIDASFEYKLEDDNKQTLSTLRAITCKNDGTEIITSGDGIKPPDITEQNIQEKLELGQAIYWLDQSNDTWVIKQFSVENNQWYEVESYVKLSFDGIGTPFSVGDGVTISLVDASTTPKEDSVNKRIQIKDNPIIWAKEDNYIVVSGCVAGALSEKVMKEVSVKRTMPDLDFVIESGNRLWGCKYGVVNRAVVNEIYASKLGDFKNWNSFQGISTDSYVASVGTDGKFTGAITHLGYPLFFKENCLHKVYGNYPANYQIQTTACRGVQEGCSRSLAIVNEVLYYKSRSGVCAYDGSLPSEISSALGEVVYSNAVAGTLGNKYYISMKDDDANDYSLFVCDTLKGMWHKEDNTRVFDFCNYRGDLYYIHYAGDEGYQIKSVKGSGTPETDKIKWEAVTGVLGTDSPDKKYISRLDVRMKLEVGTRVSFFVDYDSNDAWEYLFTMTGKSLQSFSVPVKPKRCDHLRLKIIGTGDAKIFSICKTIEQGSDV